MTHARKASALTRATHKLPRRAQDVIAPRYPWWDWGHRVMALTGRDDCGNWGPPRPRDLWFRWVSGSKAQTTRDYAVVRANPSEDWRVFDSQNDGHEIVIGWSFGPGRPNNVRDSLNGRAEIGLFRRWLFTEWAVSEWFGLRRWLYYKALRAAVSQRIPFACQATPPRESGGYDHWHCQERKRHNGPHRFRNYTWGGGPVQYAPTEVDR